MIIFDKESNRVLSEVTLFLTPAEATELGASAADLGENPAKHHHHVSSKDYGTEITVAVYTAANLSSYDQESRNIIVANALPGEIGKE